MLDKGGVGSHAAVSVAQSLCISALSTIVLFLLISILLEKEKR